MDKEQEEQAWREFIALCSQIKSPKALKAFYDLFLTHEERAALASRYVIVKALLEEKKTQREISEEYGVSISQITRGSNALKIIGNDLKDLLVHSKQKR